MKIGVLGAGQLGRMLALAGHPLGLSFVFLDPADNACAAPVGDQIQADFDDTAALARLCETVEVVTYEFENVPADAASFVAGHRPLFPGPKALATAQDRAAEKALFEQLGIPVPRNACADSLEGLRAAVAKTGLPAVVKTRRLGYDGKGQAVLREDADVERAWAQLGGTPLIVEQWVPFDREVSCIGVRGRDGGCRFYPIATNVHRHGILRRSTPVANDPLQALAERHTEKVMSALDYVGVMAFEFFVRGDQLLANEIAPRVHNSGHWTQDGAHTSQFENHLRAVLGLPLGDTGLHGPCCMLNLIGEAPDRAALLAFPGAHLHLYGKSSRQGRKIGHLNLCADTQEGLAAMLAEVEPLVDAAAAG